MYYSYLYLHSIDVDDGSDKLILPSTAAAIAA
jgi:hypothetical protein